MSLLFVLLGQIFIPYLFGTMRERKRGERKKKHQLGQIFSAKVRVDVSS